MYSPDFYTRLACDALMGIVFEHVHSAQDGAVMEDALKRHGKSAVQAGSTDWKGMALGRPVSIAWDWVKLSNGEVRMLDEVAPRTNILLIDVKGYDMAMAHSAPHLRALIDALPWCIKVHQVLADKSPLTSRPAEFAYPYLGS